MAKMNANRRIALRVKEGSALERMILTSPQKTVSGALHDMAAKLDGMQAVASSQDGSR